MVSCVIRQAFVYDGNGGLPYLADVLIENDQIIDIGQFPQVEAACIIEADKRPLLPGFIDAHTHSEVVWANGQDRREALCQGVTTEVGGSCGIGPFPLSGDKREYLSTVYGILGKLDSRISTDSLSDFFQSNQKHGTNLAMQVAHSPLRMQVLGNRDVMLTKKSLETMKALLREAFEQGACAFSTGLAYYPAAFCDTRELVELCSVARDYGRPFSIHQRSVLNRHFPNGINPLPEALQIAEESGVHLHLSHYKTRLQTMEKVEELLEPIENAYDRGMNITADFYPYPVGCGYVAIHLPLWVMEGSLSEILERLEDPRMVNIIAEQMENKYPNLADGVFIHAPKHPSYIGKSFSKVAEENGETVAKMLVRFLLEEKLDGGYMPLCEASEHVLEKLENDFVKLLKKPYYMVGSDTIPAHMSPHPRSSNTFPKILQIAKKHALQLEVLADRLSANPAKIFGFSDRGKIEPKKKADLILLSDDWQIDTVWVNGNIAVKQGKFQLVFAGQPVRARVEKY